MERDVLWDPAQRVETFVMPGVWDITSAAAAKEAGAKAIFLSGGAVSASFGVPDLGLVTTDALVELSRGIVRRVDLPLLIDGEAGFYEGSILAWFAERLVEARVTAVMIEDQECSGQFRMDPPGLCHPDDMVARIKVVHEATDGRLHVIARTDVLGKDWPFEESLARLRAYEEAGAQWLMPVGLRSRDELEQTCALAPNRVIAVATPGATGYLPSLEDARACNCRALLSILHHRLVLSHLIELYEKTIDGQIEDVLSGLIDREMVARLLDFPRYTRFARARTLG